MAAPTDILRYPNDMLNGETDYFQVQVLSYHRKGLTAGIETTDENKTKVSGVENILLPMPSNIQDANTVSWGEDKMNAIAAAGVNAASTIMTGFVPTDTNTWSKTASDAWSQISSVVPNAQDLITKQLAAEAVNVFGGNVSIDQLLARQQGQIFNPNLELLFNGVTLRDFRFSFKMTPRDDKERDSVIKIIRTFKKYMAAKKEGEGGNLYLNTPNVFRLAYMKGGERHPFLHRFKDCALKGVSVNYTGENVYATYFDGTPISIILDLNFQELTPIYNEEYGEGDVPNVNSASNLGVGY
jgi:hypothetical protein